MVSERVIAHRLTVCGADDALTLCQTCGAALVKGAVVIDEQVLLATRNVLSRRVCYACALGRFVKVTP